jgi:hypothetical protein
MEMLSTVDLLIRVAHLLRKLIMFSISKPKLASTRRSTVLNLPLQLGFPAKKVE